MPEPAAPSSSVVIHLSGFLNASERLMNILCLGRSIGLCHVEYGCMHKFVWAKLHGNRIGIGVRP